MKRIKQVEGTEIVPFCPPPSPPLSVWKSTAVSLFAAAAEIYKELNVKSEIDRSQPTYIPPSLDSYYQSFDRYYTPPKQQHTNNCCCPCHRK